MDQAGRWLLVRTSALGFEHGPNCGDIVLELLDDDAEMLGVRSLVNASDRV